MSIVLVAITMVAFAVVTSAISRREGSGISRHPFAKPYTDAPGARPLS